MIDTQGVKITFGRHKGELITRIPISYIRWMVNTGDCPQKEYAKAEFERRGDTMPSVDISGHAIDNASLRVRKIWHETRGEDEGLYSWLARITLEALQQGEKRDAEDYRYLGMKLIIAQGEAFPSLKTIMPKGKREK